MDTFDAISPLDYRYYGGDKEAFEKLQPYLSETAAIRYQLAVEVALVKTLAEKKICDKKVAAEIEAAAKKVTAAEVYEEESKIKHNIRNVRKYVISSSRSYKNRTPIVREKSLRGKSCDMNI